VKLEKSLKNSTRGNRWEETCLLVFFEWKKNAWTDLSLVLAQF